MWAVKLRVSNNYSKLQPEIGLTGQEKSARLVVGRDTLEEGQRIADPVGGGRGELRRAQEVVNADDLLQQRSHDACVTKLLARMSCETKWEQGGSHQTSATGSRRAPGPALASC